MADGNYRRLQCADCSTEFPQLVRRGRIRKHCSGCEPARKAYEPVGEREFQCSACGKSFIASHKRKLCRPGCKSGKDAFKPEARECAHCGSPFVTRKPDHTCCSRNCNVRKRFPHAALATRACACCGTEFQQKQPSQIYCRKRCMYIALGYQLSDAERQERDAAALAKRESKERAIAMSALARVVRRVAAKRRADDRAAMLASQTCKHCGCEFSAVRVLELCRACRLASDKAAQRASRKAYKMRKRASVVEVFDDMEILERDGWRCQICGVSTPRKLRGTYKPNAPEVDHIVAISKGGAHSRANCQCACRACNLRKSDGAPRGQIGLFAGAHQEGAGGRPRSGAFSL